jgi:uncharacterized SAM-binding protein YcdF (DUF218 family)
MFVFLSKLLPFFVYPVGLIVIFLALALMLYKYTRLRTTSLVLAFVILLVTSNHWVAVSLVRSLEWQYLPSGETPKAEVIVLLGGGTDAAEPPRSMVQVNGAGQRVLYTASLYKQARAAHILVSGGNLEFVGPQQSTPAQDMETLLVFMGVPEQAIWMENRSQNTYENAVDCALLLKSKGIQKIILVTSAMHMPRSVALFQKQGLTVIPAPADFSVTQAGWFDLTHAPFAAQVVDILPSSSNMNMTTNALKEYLGILTYRINGWIK